ncbi:MAG TPA: hypothetical protein VHI99_09335 [Vicinamibacterales bacterium]|jgi:hypothetical protein|nr:hypothetical protein [Vicinamibacterales bacterium]
MVTNYPQQLAARAVTSTRKTAESGFVSRAVGRLGQVLCGIGGHDSMMHFEGNRVMMRCTSCGHDTPGWEIEGRAPRLRYEGDAERHALASSEGASLRKTA